MPLLLALIIAAMPATQDTVVAPAAVQRASVAIRTIDPADADFKDLEHLKKALGTARVVVLGEPHNDGATLQAKARLIRFLHEQMGFDALVIEQDLLGVREDVRQLATETPLAELRGSVATYVDAERAWLFSYVAEQARGPRTLHLSGMDPLWNTRELSTAFGPDLVAFFDKVKPGTLPADLRAVLVGTIGHPYMADPRPMTPGRFRTVPVETVLAAKDEAVLRALLGVIVSNRPAFERTHGRNEVRFTELALENRVLNLRYHADRQQPNRANVVLGARDSLMGRAAAFLVNDYYKGRKAVISSGSHHAMSNGAELGVAGYENMIGHLRRSVPTGVYSVGFVAHEGKHGPSPGYATPIDSTRFGSPEWAASQLSADHLWIDMNQVPGMYRSKLFNTQPVALWKRHFDFAFYIRREHPLTPR
ncbi:MAG TPA: erythromycin esterase family protein [Gemmatimonas sp.]|nr:erythromycin esterase family protein [Gemmatimonas sp.]